MLQLNYLKEQQQQIINLLKIKNFDAEKIIEELEGVLEKNFGSVVSKKDMQRLEAIEKAKAQELGLEEYKMKTNEEMLAAIGGE